MSAVSGNLFSELYQEMEDQTIERALDYAELLGWSKGYREGVDDGGDDFDIDIDSCLENGLYGDGRFMSPTFNFGVSDSSSGFDWMSPTFNFAGYPTGGREGSSNILPSWDDYDWDGWEDAGEPEFETPGDYAASRGVEEGEFGGSWPSVRIKYNEVPDFPGFYGSSVDSWEGGWEMPWGGRAS